MILIFCLLVFAIDDAIYHYSIHDSVRMLKLLFEIPSRWGSAAGGDDRWWLLFVRRVNLFLTQKKCTAPHWDPVCLFVCTHTAWSRFSVALWRCSSSWCSSSLYGDSNRWWQYKWLLGHWSSSFLLDHTAARQLGVTFDGYDVLLNGICPNLDSHSSQFHWGSCKERELRPVFRTTFSRPIFFFWLERDRLNHARPITGWRYKFVLKMLDGSKFAL